MSTRVSNNWVPVYRLHQSCHSEAPAYFVKREQALRMVEEAAAIFVNRGRAIRLTFERPADLRGESCRIGPGTIFAYACGVKRAVAAVEAWNNFAIS
ncbi:MAG TPA: hypothetical protein VN579_06630 [Bryobacteraceae bacterium]|nr:hypothetical protein [Bryobacteraceae bacterium]